ncbi:MAE_28990/MAE_18760 family HEPN-like nuclease [Vibrio vulnificus]|uniref:MAE_28990/MAE_18760 family HEPN-like nuclease n=1 Tax=Vibrio vulnificus TaxID=672 RepID=UPI0031CCB1B5|nr:hypothetical protein [Vibrio vulnificus]EJA3297023.1 hypothetical protein [Vibrio vulnificus]
MFQPLCSKASQNIEVIKELLDEHEWLSANAPTAARRTEIKTFSVSSAITRLYAIYELYVETILSDYLDILADLINYSELPEGLRTEYRLGISHILSRIDQGRYSHLNHENVVSKYHAAVSSAEPYQFVTDALVRHEQNLRLNILNNLFSRLGLDNFESWVTTHPLMIDCYDSDTITKENIESRLKDIVDLRNDASHGEIDNLVNVDIMKSNCDFIASLLEVIRQFVTKNLIIQMEKKDKAIKLGKVTESFGNNGAFILRANNGISVSTSDKIFIKGTNSFISQDIQSIRINEEGLETVNVVDENTEIGIKCAEKVRKNTYLYKEI